MKFYKILVVLMATLLVLFTSACGDSKTTLRIATTTSVDNTGLLDMIIEEFNKSNPDIEVDVISAGTGAALQYGKDKEVDLLIVHAEDEEIAFVDEGYGEDRYTFMYNYFVLLGNTDTTYNTINDYYTAAQSSGKYVSRGDNSGTHMKEQSIFTSLGLTYGDWVDDIGKGMSATLTYTNEVSGYTISDKGTYLSMKSNLSNLYINYEQDELLYNPYSTIIVSQDEIKEATTLFYNFLIGEDVKDIITNYTVEDEQLFYVIEE